MNLTERACSTAWREGSRVAGYVFWGIVARFQLSWGDGFGLGTLVFVCQAGTV